MRQNTTPGHGPALVTDAARLARTRVVATLEAGHDAEHSLLYCASLPLAWRELIELNGGPIEMVPQTDAAVALNVAVGQLPGSVLDEASFVARGGEGPSVLEAIRQEMASKFPDATPTMLPTTVPSDVWLVYSYVFKSLALETPLAREESHGLRFRGRAVKHFGVWDTNDPRLHADRAKQIVVHDVRSEDDFVVELLTQVAGDQLIVARIPPGESLRATCSDALARARSSAGLMARLTGSQKLRRADVLKIPVVDFEIAKSYGELTGVPIVDKPRFIERCDQQIRLRLDEKGALLRSEVRIGAPRGGGLRWPPRTLLCEGPFLLAMARRDADEPYLALWIDNDELLFPLD